MIQFNLLPDVKLEYVKAQRMKHLLTVVSILVSAVALGVLLIAFVAVNVVQKKSLQDLNNDISKYSTQLKDVPNLNKILTVQNQLSTLTGLHDKKPATDRLFGYIAQVTPAQAALNNLNIDLTANKMAVSGTAPSLDVVSAYTTTLKSTNYTSSQVTSPKKVFSNVVLSSFSYSDTGASFTINVNFDPAIFVSTTPVTLTVPQTSQSIQSNIFGSGGQ